MCREAYLSTFFVVIVALAHSTEINNYSLTLRPQHIDLISPVYPSKIVRIISTIIPLGNKRILVMESGEIELQCNEDFDSNEKKWNTSNPDQSRFYIHENGNLEIKNIQLIDDGNYTCYYKLESCELSENEVVSHIAYYINVYEIPTLCHKITWKYLLLDCDRQLEIAYRDWLFNKILDEHLSPNTSQWQLKYFKINCVEIDEPTTELQVEICMGYSFSSIRTDDNYVEFADTGPINEKLDNLHRNLKQFTEFESYSNLEYQSYTFNMKLSWFCQSGHHIRFNVCLACPLGYYSIAPAVECQACKAGYYSDKLRSSFCLKCPKGTITSKAGATSLTHCVEPLWITILWYVLFILPSIIGWAFALAVCLAKRKAAKRKRIDVVNGKEIQRDVIDLTKVEDKRKNTDLIKELEGKQTNLKREKAFEDLPAYENVGFRASPGLISENELPAYENVGFRSSPVLISKNELPAYENIGFRLSQDPRTAEEYIKNYTNGTTPNKSQNYYSQVAPDEDEEIVFQRKLQNYYSPVAEDEAIASPNKLQNYYSQVAPDEETIAGDDKDVPYYSPDNQTLQNENYQTPSIVEDEPYYFSAPKTKSEKESNSNINKSQVYYTAANPESSTTKARIMDEPIYAKISKQNTPYTLKTYPSKLTTTEIKKPDYYSTVSLEQQPAASQLKKLSNAISKEIIEHKQKKMLPIDENLLFE